MHRFASVFFFYWIVANAIHAEDLATHYTATLTETAELTGYDWTCEKEDAWRLKSFSVKYRDEFSLHVDESQVVFGKHGHDVLWAVVIPDQPGTIAKASDGQNERVTSIWLRFHPSRLSELFPEATVLDQDDEPKIEFARRIVAHKVRSSYHVSGRPAVVALHHLIVDCETKELNRRFFVIDSKKDSIEYVDAFRQRSLPTAKPLAKGEAIDVFEKAWDAFDRQYAMFAIKPNVNWDKLHEEFRTQADKAGDNAELAGVINEMLWHLQDLHVYVSVDGIELERFRRDRPLNANEKAVVRFMGEIAKEGPEILWQVFGNIGYIRITGLSDKDTHASFKKALFRMRKTKGLILDLRFNGGGSELIAQAIAGHFLDESRAYAMSQYRSGPKHTDLTEKKKRTFSPEKKFPYAKRVVALQGQRTMSSAEAMILMLRQCPNVVTMGDRTAGSSGNPIQVECGAGITVNVPRWIPLDANGECFDSIGIQPVREVPAEPRDFQNEDPVLRAAMRHLMMLRPETPPINLPRKPLPKEISELWAKVMDVNKGWLEPRPDELFYAFKGELSEDKRCKLIGRVWISNESTRWEFESAITSALDPFAGQDPFQPKMPEVVRDQELYLFDGDIEHAVLTKNPRELDKKRKARDMRPFRQGIMWRTAVHYFARNALPADSRIIARVKDGENENVVLELMSYDPDQFLHVGLGIYGLSFGGSTHPIHAVRLHIRLPDYVFLKEEHSDSTDRYVENSVHYGHEYLKFRDGLAPRWISHRLEKAPSGNRPATTSVSTARFQIIDGQWLLKDAEATKDGKKTSSIVVSDVSTAAIPKDVFGVKTIIGDQSAGSD